MISRGDECGFVLESLGNTAGDQVWRRIRHEAFIDASVAGRNDAEGVVKELVVNTDGVQLGEGGVGSYIVELKSRMRY